MLQVLTTSYELPSKKEFLKTEQSAMIKLLELRRLPQTKFPGLVGNDCSKMGNDSLPIFQGFADLPFTAKNGKGSDSSE